MDALFNTSLNTNYSSSVEIRPEQSSYKRENLLPSSSFMKTDENRRYREETQSKWNEIDTSQKITIEEYVKKLLELRELENLR